MNATTAAARHLTVGQHIGYMGEPCEVLAVVQRTMGDIAFVDLLIHRPEHGRQWVIFDPAFPVPLSPGPERDDPR